MPSVLKTNICLFLAAVLYLELWKRYSARLVHRWGLTGYTQDVEHPRPQYLAKIRKNKKLAEKLENAHDNSVFEPDVPFWTTKFLPSFTSYSIMVLFVSLMYKRFNPYSIFNTLTFPYRYAYQL